LETQLSVSKEQEKITEETQLGFDETESLKEFQDFLKRNRGRTLIYELIFERGSDIQL